MRTQTSSINYLGLPLKEMLSGKLLTTKTDQAIEQEQISSILTKCITGYRIPYCEPEFEKRYENTTRCSFFDILYYATKSIFPIFIIYI
jgi:hypothetical protein